MPINNTQYRQVFTRLEELPAGTDSFARCRFENCRLPGAVLNGLTFEECLFCGCDLTRASFLRTHLERADFITSFGLALDPETNCLRGARFSVYALPGLLTKYGIVTEELS